MSFLSSNIPDDLDSRFSRLVSGMLAENEMAELEEILTRSPEARDAYRQYLAIHLDLVEYCQQSDGIAPARPAPAPFTRWVLAAAAVVMAMLAIALWSESMRRHGSMQAAPAPAPAPTEIQPLLGVTARAEGVRWNLPEPAIPGNQLPPGEIRLDEGLLVLDLVGGQSLTVRGPARFELVDRGNMRLDKGEVSLRVRWKENIYAIRVPGGAVVDLGTEFSVKVDDDGVADVWVFQGQAAASRTENGTVTREELILNEGESIRIAKDFAPSPSRADEFLRSTPANPEKDSPAGDAYAQAVADAKPLAWWRFEEASETGEILAATPTAPPLVLHGKPGIHGTTGRRYMRVDLGNESGFAAPPAAIAGLDGLDGMSVECLLYPEELTHMTAVALDEPSLPTAFDEGKVIAHRHAPHRALIERMGLSGSFAGHKHPDYALRAMLRAPAGYSGGMIAYSDPQPLRQWIHVGGLHPHARASRGLHQRPPCRRSDHSSGTAKLSAPPHRRQDAQPRIRRPAPVGRRNR